MQKATIEEKVTCWLFPATLAILFVKFNRVLCFTIIFTKCRYGKEVIRYDLDFLM